jgi:peroxiredoxin
MRKVTAILLCLFAGSCWAQEGPLTEAEFRKNMGLADGVQIGYRDLQCNAMTFDEFAAGMAQPGVTSEMTRAPDGSAVALSLHRRGGASCPSPFGAVREMPAFDLTDLAGKRMTSAELRGKPTLVNFYFAACVPCILEVGPLNQFAASRKDLNVLAVTFDEPAEARAFVKRYKFQWRVVPDAQEFIDRMAVKRYPMLVLFDAQGRLLGMRAGGVKDEFEAATLGPVLKRWVDGLLRTSAR